MRRAIRKAVPQPLREARYKLRRIGLRKFARYHRIERVEQRKQGPRAGQPFDLGGASIVVHETTIPAIRSHWINDGHAILEMRAFKRLAQGHGLLFDIGAAEGIYSGAFCALTGGAAWAFEPSQMMCARLQGLCDLNPDFAIHINRVALGASPGQRRATAYPDGQLSGTDDGGEIMDVKTLDDFVANHGVAADFAKIDVEGMELEVLRGGESTFRHAVKAIVLEVHYDMLARQGQSTRELQSLLTHYGYRLEDLHGSPIVDLDRFATANPEPLPGYTVIICRK